MAQPREISLPDDVLILLVDGLWFQFHRRPWVVYLMALKPRRSHRAHFLDPVVLPGPENVHRWAQAFTTIPPAAATRIRAVVSDDLRGMAGLVAQHGWVLQLCHFHLISQLHNSRGRRKRSLPDRPQRDERYRLIRRALELPDGAALDRTLDQVRAVLERPLVSRRLRMVAHEFLRRHHHFRAYRQYPDLGLPTTTGTLEAMGRLIRHLMNQLRHLSTPAALQLWVTAFIRVRRELRCNGREDQPNSFV